MSIAEFRKLQKVLKIVLSQAEKEAIEKGVDITTPEFEQAILKLKEATIIKAGFNMAEYEKIGQQMKEKTREKLKGDKGDSIKGDKGDSIKGDKGDTIIGPKGEKGDTVIGPRGPQGRDGKTVIALRGKRGEPGKDADIKGLEEKFNKFTKAALKDSADHITRAIDVIGMPDFRKLGMGLQGQIDELTTSVGKATPIAPEDLSAQLDGAETEFTTTHDIYDVYFVYLNGTILIENQEFTFSGNTITLTFAPDSDEKLVVKYAKK